MALRTKPHEPLKTYPRYKDRHPSRVTCMSAQGGKAQPSANSSLRCLSSANGQKSLGKARELQVRREHSARCRNARCWTRRDSQLSADLSDRRQHWHPTEEQMELLAENRLNQTRQLPRSYTLHERLTAQRPNCDSSAPLTAAAVRQSPTATHPSRTAGYWRSSPGPAATRSHRARAAPAASRYRKRRPNPPHTTPHRHAPSAAARGTAPRDATLPARPHQADPAGGSATAPRLEIPTRCRLPKTPSAVPGGSRTGRSGPGRGRPGPKRRSALRAAPRGPGSAHSASLTWPPRPAMIGELTHIRQSTAARRPLIAGARALAARTRTAFESARRAAGRCLSESCGGAEVVSSPCETRWYRAPIAGARGATQSLSSPSFGSSNDRGYRGEEMGEQCPRCRMLPEKLLCESRPAGTRWVGTQQQEGSVCTHRIHEAEGQDSFFNRELISATVHLLERERMYCCVCANKLSCTELALCSNIAAVRLWPNWIPACRSQKAKMHQCLFEPRVQQEPGITRHVCGRRVGRIKKWCNGAWREWRNLQCKNIVLKKNRKQRHPPPAKMKSKEIKQLR